jgi:hypothetical protein
MEETRDGGDEGWRRRGLEETRDGGEEDGGEERGKEIGERRRFF